MLADVANQHELFDPVLSTSGGGSIFKYCPDANAEAAERGDALPLGWETGTVKEFLGLTDEEAAEIERKIGELGLLKEDEEELPLRFPKGGYVSQADMERAISDEINSHEYEGEEEPPITYYDMLRRKFEEDHK